MFDPELRAAQSQALRRFTVWLPLFNKAANLVKEIVVDKSDEKFQQTLTAGLSGVPEMLHRMAMACVAVNDPSLSQVAPIAAVPLYVMEQI